MTPEIAARVCKICGQEKPFDQLIPDKNAKYGRMQRCKPCHAARQRKRWHDPVFREHDLARRKEWHDKHYRFRRYGITREQYEQMFEAQGHKCRLCGSEKAGAGRDKQWCIDHCHKTNRVRGILCHNCNTALGYYERLVGTMGEAALLRYIQPSGVIVK